MVIINFEAIDITNHDFNLSLIVLDKLEIGFMVIDINIKVDISFLNIDMIGINPWSVS